MMDLMIQTSLLCLSHIVSIIIVEMDKVCNSFFVDIAVSQQYGSTVYIGIAMVFVFHPYIRKIQFLLSVSG